MIIEELPQFVKVAERKYKGLKITVKKYTSRTEEAILEGESMRVCEGMERSMERSIEIERSEKVWVWD